MLIECSGLGNVLGPALGGLLSDTGPEAYIFGRYPYLLPNLVCAGYATLSFALTAHYLPETLQREQGAGSRAQGAGIRSVSLPETLQRDSSSTRALPATVELPTASLAVGMWTTSDAATPARAAPDAATPARAPDAATPARAAPDPPATTAGSDDGADKGDGVACSSNSHGVSLMTTATSTAATSSTLPLSQRLLPPRRAMIVVGAYCALAFVMITFDEVLPLWLVAPRASGGMGMQLPEVGIVLTVSGVAIIIWQIFAMPYITRRCTHTRVFAASCIASSITVALVPANGHVSPTAAMRWPLLVGTMIVVRFANAGAFTVVFILINNSVARRQRGRVQGLAMAAAAAMRASGPIIGSCLFAWSVTNGLGERVTAMGAPFVFWLCALLFLATGLVAMVCMPLSYNTEVCDDDD